MNKKTFSIFLFTTLLTNTAYCMKRVASSSIEQVKSSECIVVSSLPIEVMGNILIDSFKTPGFTEPAQMVQKKIQTICLISKKLCDYIYCPNNIRTIINNAAMGHHWARGTLANYITTPAVQNYLQQSEELHKKIDILTAEEIRNLIFAGADINFHNIDRKKTVFCPILFATKTDYNKTQLLLELGADPYLPDAFINRSAFTQAIVEKNIEILKLYIKYYPKYHTGHAEIAQQTNDTNIINLILQQQKDIPIDEL